MSSQNDKPFNDDEDVFEAELADQPSSLSGADIKDISDESIEDISDYDDSEEGIFAATPPEKKKSSSSSSFLLGTVAIIALLGAGGFYVSQTPELLAKVKAMIPMASLDEAIAPVAEIAGQSAVAVGDPDLAAIPQPQPIANVVDSSTAPVDTTVTASPVDAPTDAPVAADIPPPPTPSETQAAVDSSKPVDPPASSEAVINVAPNSTEPVKITMGEESNKIEHDGKTTIVPVDNKPAVPAEPPQTGLEKVVAAEAAIASGNSSTNVVTKPDRDEKSVYFDSPGGEILKSIPAPAMSAKRGTNESVIIVSKPNSKSVISASTTQEARVAAANRALKLGRYEAALDLYNQLYAANPRDGRILMGRAVALQKLGNIPDAVAAYETLLDMDADNPEAIVNLMGLIRKEYPAVALEKLLGLQERHPNNPAIIAQLGIAYADAGNFEQATTTLNKAAVLEPNNAQHYFNLAVVAERMKDRPRAIDLYEKALETDAVYGSGRAIDRNMIYDRLTRIRG